MNFKTNFLGLALAGMILGACSQMGTYENADLMNEQAVAKAGFNMTPFGMGSENKALSDAPCIDSDSGDEFSANFSANYNQNFSASVRVYNTLTHVIYEFGGSYDCIKMNNFNGSAITLEGNQYKVPLASWKHGDLKAQSFWIGRNGCNGQGNGQAVTIATSYNLVGICTDTTLSAGTTEDICEGDEFTLTATVAADGAFTGGVIEILGAEDMVVATSVVTADNKTVTYSGPWNDAGSYTFTARYAPSNTNGYKASASSSSTVVVKECNVGCENASFSYQASVAGIDMVNVIFTYNHNTSLDNAVVKFTFPQIKNVSVGGIYFAPDGKTYSVNNNGNNTVFTWNGDIACTNAEAETFEFKVTADCNASGKAQIWTNASVNGNSVKNESTPNIRFYCSTQTIEKINAEN